jgi:signal transduction histidine kinase
VRRAGLASALRRLAVLLAPETPEIRIDLTHFAPQALASEETLFRMCQEALSNAIRHSGARLVTVHSRLEDTYLTVVVEDNGCGFSFADEQLMRTERDGGLGLHTLRERAISLGGAVSYQSTLGHGTRVTFTIPRRDRTSQ